MSNRSVGRHDLGTSDNPTISVLVVEDDEADTIILVELLSDVAPEIRIDWVQSIAAADQRFAERLPECVLLDLHLPDADGLDALERIRSSAPQVPVVVLTGLADQNFGAAAVAAGAQDYLIKGRFEPDALRRAVHYAIMRKRAEITTVQLQASNLRAEENARLERGLLPTPAVGAGVDVVARYRPGRSGAVIGGDFYDVVQTDDDTVQVLIGDVSGHGPDEAALGVALRIAWRALVIAGVCAEQRMVHMDRLLRAERGERFVFATVISLTFQISTGKVGVIRAGHPPMLCHGPGTVVWVETPGTSPLGMLDDIEMRREHPFTLPPGHGIVLITDGLFEGYSGTGTQRLGEGGLMEIAQQFALLPAAAFIDAMIDAAESLARPHGGFSDDVAVLRLQASKTEDGRR